MYGERIKVQRKKYNLKQIDLAKILNTTQSTIGKYEREELQPDIENIVKLSQYFNVSTDYLIGIKDEPDIDADVGNASKFNNSFNNINNNGNFNVK